MSRALPITISPEPAPAAAPGRTPRARLIALRWLALAGAVIAILAAPVVLGVSLPQQAMLYVVAGMLAVNLFLQQASPRPASDLGLAMQFCMDIAALAVLLYLSGGSANPLISLLLLPVAFAAAILPPVHALAIAGCSIAAYSLLSLYSVPLKLADHEYAMRLHLTGMWLTFVISALIIACYVARLTATVRTREHELATARELALRNERIVALGALAASAAHELGTPLATMSVLAGELAAHAGLTDAARADIALLQQQILNCKSIITSLAFQAGGDRAESGRSLSLDLWLGQLVARWLNQRPHAKTDLKCLNTGPAPNVVTEANIEHALLNLLNNAADASADPVDISFGWTAQHISIAVSDNGPGFDAATLAYAGRAPIARKGDNFGAGAGIGLFLAHAAIERIGGTVTLTNREPAGAMTRVELPLAALAVTLGGNAP
jgi:two-component system sensor histidine kinase RegB